MTQPQKPQKICQYIDKADGKHCELPVGDISWKFCATHRLVARRERKREDGRYFRENKREQYEGNRYRYNRGLTKPQLRAFFDCAEALQEHHPRSKYEGYEYADNILHEIMGLILAPSADFPSSAYFAHMKAQKLLESLKAQKQDAPKDSNIDWLNLTTLALQRDIGEQMSAKTFTNIERKARLVREMMRAQGETLGFGYSLFVDVEIERAQYFAHFALPEKRQIFANKALRVLTGVEAFCDMLVERSKGELADFLRFYVESARLRLAFDAGERDHISSLIEAANDRATTFANAYSTEQIVATVEFLNYTNQAEYQLLCGKCDCSTAHLKKAENLFNEKMQWHSIEAIHRIASIKTHLALKSDDDERERCVHEYLSVLDRYHCFEYRHVLRELKRCYDSQVPDVDLLTLEDESLFVGTTFSHILPFVVRI